MKNKSRPIAPAKAPQRGPIPEAQQPGPALVTFSFKYWDRSNNKFQWFVNKDHNGYVDALLSRLQQVSACAFKDFTQSNAPFRSHILRFWQTSEKQGFSAIDELKAARNEWGKLHKAAAEVNK